VLDANHAGRGPFHRQWNDCGEWVNPIICGDWNSEALRWNALGLHRRTNPSPERARQRMPQASLSDPNFEIAMLHDR
jgi:hypothetical protein